ncbi:5-hydroxytryptamine receptor 4 [Centroberyx gerrardi]
MAAYTENRWGLPQCIGAIDGSHIPILAPQEYHCDYFNRKGWHSIILQGVSASRGNRFPAYTRNIGGVNVGYYILGDSAYPLQNWLLKPFPDTGRLTAEQQIYNKKICRARSRGEAYDDEWDAAAAEPVVAPGAEEEGRDLSLDPFIGKQRNVCTSSFDHGVVFSPRVSTPPHGGVSPHLPTRSLLLSAELSSSPDAHRSSLRSAPSLRTKTFFCSRYRLRSAHVPFHLFQIGQKAQSDFGSWGFSVVTCFQDPASPQRNGTLCIYGYMNVSAAGQMPVMEELVSESDSMPKRMALICFLSLVMLMSILGNLLVMVAVCKDRQLRKIKTNYFIVSLAFADLLVSVLVMPFGAIELVHQHWIYGETFCLVRTSLDVLLTTASILHLCCIALDRYYAICCQPLVYRNKMTPMRVALMIGGCWVIPTFISFLPIMQGWNSIGIDHVIEERRYSEGSNSTSCVFMVNKPYALTCSVVAFYIPLVLMVLAYQRIYVTARAHALQISMLQRAGGAGTSGSSVDSADHQRNHRMRTETKAAKTLCIIMGCFCLCWAPFFVTNVVDPFIDYTVPDKLWAACLWLGYINSMLNPILYAFLNKSFRRAFLIILCCGRKRYRRPSILGPGAPCTATQINGSTHVLKYSVLHNGNHTEQEKKSLHNETESHESCF